MSCRNGTHYSVFSEEFGISENGFVLEWMALVNNTEVNERVEVKIFSLNFSLSEPRGGTSKS